jgi:sulfopyruvate decarboxylase alpha subunit
MHGELRDFSATMTQIHDAWPDDVHRALAQAAVRQVAYVPDGGLTGLIEACQADDAMTAVSLTTEEEGIAMLAGAWLGGARGVLLMQSSGVGNCVNMLSLIHVCRFPLVAIVTMRGEEGETNPWQMPMGRNTRAAFEMAGVDVHRADAPGDVAGLVAEAAHAAFADCEARAVLIGQGVVGVKQFED